MKAPKLIDVINVMESNIEVPLSLPAIAERCNLSLRQIERLFHKHREQTPSQYYLSLRFDARQAAFAEHQSQRHRRLDRDRLRNPVLLHLLLPQVLWQLASHPSLTGRRRAPTLIL